MGDELEGFRVVAASLKSLGITHMFGVVGIPVVEVSSTDQKVKQNNGKLLNGSTTTLLNCCY